MSESKRKKVSNEKTEKVQKTKEPKAKKIEKQEKSIVNEVKQEKIIPNKKTKQGIYINFETRLLIAIILFVVLFALGTKFLLKSINYTDEQKIEYSEKSNIDYKVYLKENKFYEEEYLNKDMLYIASLIDNIEIEFDYVFEALESTNIDFKYDLMAKIVIADEEKNNSYFEKEYTLLSERATSTNGLNQKRIKEKINIDYEYYNELANQFKMSYGVDAVSNLLIYFKIDKNSQNENDIFYSNASSMFIKIPLSEKSVDIEMDYQEINNTSELVSRSGVKINNVVYLEIAIGAFIFSIISCIYSIRLITYLRTKKNTYDKYIKRIMNEYDRLIVETTTSPNIKSNNVIKIKKFEELLDVRDNLKLPIMFHEVTKHQKSYFYIKHNEDIYLLTIKNIDLETKEK